MAKISKAVRAILERINTAEKAVALKGAERAEYLKALDEAYGPVEQRAADMGFGSETWYHGTAEDFPAFDPEKLNKTITRNQFWVSDNPEVANAFAKSKGHNKKAKEYIALKEQNKDLIERIEKEYPRWQGDNLPQRIIDFDKQIGEITEKEAQTLTSLQNKLSDLKDSLFFRKKMIGGGGENILPVKVRRETDKVIDASNKNWQDVKKMIGDEEILVKNVQEDVRPAGQGESIAPIATSLGVKKPEQIRSTNAAFDPRFKDSPLLMAGVGMTTVPKEEDMKKDKKSLTEKAKQVGSKAAELGGAALEKLSIPQQILMRRTAQAMGVEASDDVGKSAENITEKIASKLGIPEDSEYVGPAAKAAIQTALEVGYDPLNLVGAGIAGKAAKAARKSKVVAEVLGKLGKGEQALAKLPTMAAREEAVLAGKMRDIRAQEVADIKKQVRQMERAEALPVAEKKALLEKNMADEYKRVAERMKEVEKDKQYWQARQPQAVFPKATPAELLAERKQAAQIEARTLELARKAQQEDLARQTKAIESEMPAIRAERAASLDKTPPLVPVSKSDEAKKLAEEILKKRKK